MKSQKSDKKTGIPSFQMNPVINKTAFHKQEELNSMEMDDDLEREKMISRSEMKS